MAPTKCYYLNCFNTTKTHSMFRFPINRPDRLQTWIQNSGNIHSVNLKHYLWKNRYLCSEHFDSVYLHKYHYRTRLMPTANPRSYKCEDETTIEDNVRSQATEADLVDLRVLPSQKVYRKRHCHIVEETSQLKRELDTPLLKRQKLENYCMDEKCVEARILLRDSMKTYKKQNELITWLRNKLSTHNKHYYQQKCPSEASKTIASMQLHRRTAKWNAEEKSLSLALFQESQECYSFMLNEGIVLPDLATINRWLSKTTCRAGVAEDGGSVKEQQKEDCGASKKGREEYCCTSIKEESKEDYSTKVNEECEKDYGASVTYRLEKDCGTRADMEVVEDCDASVKEEFELEFDTSVNEEFLENCDTSIKEEHDNYCGASVKLENENERCEEENDESATEQECLLFAEHEVKSELILDPEQVFLNDIARCKETW